MLPIKWIGPRSPLLISCLGQREATTPHLERVDSQEGKRLWAKSRRNAFDRCSMIWTITTMWLGTPRTCLKSRRLLTIKCTSNRYNLLIHSSLRAKIIRRSAIAKMIPRRGINTLLVGDWRKRRGQFDSKLIQIQRDNGNHPMKGYREGPSMQVMTTLCQRCRLSKWGLNLKKQIKHLLRLLCSQIYR